jgi:hypothetical protein
MGSLAYVNPRRRLMSRFTLALVAFAACDATGPEPQFLIWLTPSTAQTLTVDDTLPMVATLEGRAPCECRWGSSDAAVATVSSEGLVRAVAPGFTTITATLVRDSQEMRSVGTVVAAGR